MNPTELKVGNAWQRYTLAGPAVLQVRQGKVFLAYNEEPAYDRDAYTVSTIFPIRGVTEIFVKTAANNREPSVIVLGDVEESDSGSSTQHVIQSVTLKSGGTPGAMPSYNTITNGAILRFSAVLPDMPNALTDINIRIVQPLIQYADSIKTLISYQFTADNIFKINDVITLYFTIYFSAIPTHKLTTSGGVSEVSVWEGASENISVIISYDV